MTYDTTTYRAQRKRRQLYRDAPISCNFVNVYTKIAD